MYFTKFIGRGQISMNIAVDPFPSDFYTHVMPIRNTLLTVLLMCQHRLVLSLVLNSAKWRVSCIGRNP